MSNVIDITERLRCNKALGYTEQIRDLLTEPGNHDAEILNLLETAIEALGGPMTQEEEAAAKVTMRARDPEVYRQFFPEDGE